MSFWFFEFCFRHGMRSCHEYAECSIEIYVARCLDRKFTAQSCLKVSAVAFSCEAALVSGYGFGYIVMKIDLRLLGLCVVPWVQGRLMLRLCGLMLRLGCRNNLFLCWAYAKQLRGKIFLPWMQVLKMLTCKTLGQACAKCQTRWCVCLCVCMCLRKTNNVKFGMQIL